jgi:hypothetical protein
MRLTDEQIELELRALRETPSERIAAELDAWAAAGFPSGRELDTQPESARRRRRWGARVSEGLERLRRRPLRAAFAGGAVIVLAVSVAAGVYSALDDEGQFGGADQGQSVGDQGSGGQPDSAEPQSAAPQGAGRAAEQAPGTSVEPAPTPVPPVPSQGELKPGRERIQERSASMTLSTEPEQVDEVADGVVEVTERFDGIVVSSNVSTSDGQGRASFDLRIPSQNLQAALAELSDLADVASRDEGTLDITAPFVGAEERFDDAKAAVDSLLEQLAAADSPAEVASIREQLRQARGELAAARSELGALKQRADFSKLSLTVVGDGDGDGWSIGDAAGDAVDVLEALGGAALVVLAVLLPLGGFAALIWLGARALRRRGRERALDES